MVKLPRCFKVNSIQVTQLRMRQLSIEMALSSYDEVDKEPGFTGILAMLMFYYEIEAAVIELLRKAGRMQIQFSMQRISGAEGVTIMKREVFTDY